MLNNYYDRTHGLLSRSAFQDPELFSEEMERVFARAWLFVGHESQIPNPNDFVASRMGLDRVVVTRSKQGNIHVLLNTCRHKGMRVVRYDEGNTRTFTCPYHAWTYSTDGGLVDCPGQLIATQEFEKAYDGVIDKNEWGLINARVAVYKGAIFATWDDNAPSFEEYLGDMHHYLDLLLDPQDGSDSDVELIGGVMRWRVNANWKACSENFIGDYLHNVSHRSVEMAGIGPAGKSGSRHGIADFKKSFAESITDISFPKFGHGCLGVEPRKLTDENFDHFPAFSESVGPLDEPSIVDAYYREVAAERKRRANGSPKVTAPQVVGGLFPNMSFHTTFPRTIALWHPVAPGVTEAWRFCVVDKDAPQEVKDLVRHHFMRYSGPAGMTEQDDMENWSYLTEATGGNIARRYPFNYQARLNHQRASNVLADATVTDHGATEGGIRGYYAAWQRHLSSASWGEYMRAVEEEE